MTAEVSALCFVPVKLPVPAHSHTSVLLTCCEVGTNVLLVAPLMLEYCAPVPADCFHWYVTVALDGDALAVSVAPY